MLHLLLFCLMHALTVRADLELITDGDTIGWLRGEEYRPQTNFDFRFVKKVLPPPELNHHSGFVVEVTHTIGSTTRKGYVICEP